VQATEQAKRSAAELELQAAAEGGTGEGADKDPMVGRAGKVLDTEVENTQGPIRGVRSAGQRMEEPHKES
jgi:hypothetical protein